MPGQHRLAGCYSGAAVSHIAKRVGGQRAAAADESQMKMKACRECRGLAAFGCRNCLLQPLLCYSLKNRGSFFHPVCVHKTSDSYAILYSDCLRDSQTRPCGTEVHRRELTLHRTLQESPKHQTKRLSCSVKHSRQLASAGAAAHTLGCGSTHRSTLIRPRTQSCTNACAVAHQSCCCQHDIDVTSWQVLVHHNGRPSATKHIRALLICSYVGV